MAQHLWILVFVALASSSYVLGNFVKRLDVQMADCKNCGMGILSKVTLKLCGNGPGICCIAEDLNNPLVNDFDQGALSSFTGEKLKECNNYDLGDNVNWNTSITLYHYGTDGGQFEHASVFTTEMIAKCYFHKFLDGSDSETGRDCIVVGKISNNGE